MQKIYKKLANSSQMNLIEIKEHLKAKRRSKRTPIKESFYCQCGKVYLSFSALYLHGKIKHNLKMTSKKDSSLFRVENSQGLIKFVYSLPNSQQQTSREGIQAQIQIPDEHKKLKKENSEQIDLFQINILANYINLIDCQQERNMIKQFIIYSASQSTEGWQNQRWEISKIPVFLNTFLLDFLPKTQHFEINSARGMQACIYLYNFCEWLQSSNLTDFQVSYNYS